MGITKFFNQVRGKALHSLNKLPEIDLADLITAEQSLKSPILEDCCMPPHHYMENSHDDYNPMMQLIVNMQPKKLIELGTAHGNTTANICNNTTDTHIYTVNAPLDIQTGGSITFQLTEAEIGRVYKQNGFADRVTQIFQNTMKLDLDEYLEKESVDFCIIDACHDFKYVINDFKKTLPYMAKDGIVLFHDTHPSMESHLVGSYSACAYLRAIGYDIRRIKDTWWGIYINA